MLWDQRQGVECRAKENLKALFNGDPTTKNKAVIRNKNIYPEDPGKKTRNEFRQWEYRRYSDSKVGLKW